MRLKLRKKIWRKHWFFLRLEGHDFKSFNTNDYRYCLNCRIDWDHFSDMSIHVR